MTRCKHDQLEGTCDWCSPRTPVATIARRDGDQVVVIIGPRRIHPNMLHEMTCREVNTKAHVEFGHEPWERRFMTRAEAEQQFPGIRRCQICGPAR